MDEPVLLGGFSNFRLVDFRYHIGPDPSYIEIVMSDSRRLRHLRFDQPSRLKIEEGFQGSLSGMEIVDISSRQWGGIGIEVRNFEQDAGITFVARSLEVLSDAEIA